MNAFRTFAVATTLLGAAALSTPAMAQGLSFSAGGTLTTNYMSRGVTQSDNNAAVQFYGEVENSGFYAGVWGSTVDFGPLDPDSLEVDLYAGYRFSVGAASFDIGYAHYFYDDSGSCCGEFYALFQVEPAPSTSLFGGIYVDGGSGHTLNDIHLGVSYGFSDAWSASVTAGRASGGVRYGILGVGYTINDNLDVALDYHATNAQQNQLVLSLNLNF